MSEKPSFSPCCSAASRREWLGVALSVCAAWAWPGVVQAQAGKMVRMSTSITSEVQSVAKSGGLMGGLKRMLGGESFFFSHYTATGGAGVRSGCALLLSAQPSAWAARLDVDSDCLIR